MPSGLWILGAGNFLGREGGFEVGVLGAEGVQWG
jgi:hypothetical protein